MMLSLNQDFSNFVLPLNVYYEGRATQDVELSKILNDLELMVDDYAHSEASIELCSNHHLDFLFKARLIALRYLLTHNFHLEDLPADEIKNTSVDPRFESLEENLAFAFRTINRVARSLSKAIEGVNLAEAPPLHESIGAFKGMSYTDFVSALGILLPSEALQPIVDWLTASLNLDYSISIGIIILKKNTPLSDLKIDELTTCVAQSAQRYGAYSRIMRPKKDRSMSRHFYEKSVAELMPENDFLTEVGLQEWTQDIEW